MKLVPLVAGLLIFGYAQAQVPPACHEALQKVCSGKTGQDAVNCLKSNADKLPAKCKDSLPKAGGTTPKS